MPKKLLRLGLTECALLYIFWLNQNENFKDPELYELKKDLIKWLYTTSGYYDKTQIGNYFNVEHPISEDDINNGNIPDNDTLIYKLYMNNLLYFIKDSDLYDFKFDNLYIYDNEYKFQNSDVLAMIPNFKQFVNHLFLILLNVSKY